MTAGWVAYVGPFPFPWGAAGSRRVLGVAMSLAHAGRRVVVASGSPARVVDAPEVVHREGAGRGVVEHVPLGELLAPGTPFALKAIRHYLTWGRRTVDWLDSQVTKPSCVIVYGGGTPYARRIRRWCRNNQVAAVADVVEWYSPKQLRGGFLGPDHVSAKWALMYEYSRLDGIVAISQHLKTHFGSRGLPTVVVPPTLDVTAQPMCEPEPRDRLQVLYFGTPGRKDSIWECLRAAREVGHAVELVVAGPSESEVRALAPREELPGNVRFLGRKPQAEVASLVARADFTILAREDARYTRAGFPTKVVESLAAGTPVIANITSDLGEYLLDGREALVAIDGTAYALADALRRAVALSKEERLAMRVRARACAGQFDYRAHAASLEAWLRTLERAA